MSAETNNLSAILKQLRAERGASLREFGQSLNISHAYLSKLENGSDPRTGKPVSPTVETLEKIAIGLDVSLKRFMEICDYFPPGVFAKEDIDEASFSLDTEISSIIARLTPNVTVTVGETQIGEEAKQALCKYLMEILIKMQQIYNPEGENFQR